MLPSERGGAQGLVYLALYGGTLFPELINQTWVRDGVNKPALESLGLLAQWQREDYQSIVEHPTIKDGITDDEAKVVATLYRVNERNPALVDKLLDPERVMLEERLIELPLAGPVQLTIIRTAPGVEHTMNLLEQAIRDVEKFMGAPFPQPQVNYLFAEATSGTGSNAGTHITSRLKVDKVGYTKNEHETSFPGESAYRHFVHETSHFYWGNSDDNWLDEGPATFLESIFVGDITGESLTLERGPCPFVSAIAKLDSIGPEQTDAEFTCNYRFGERIFHDLYRNMDETTFRLAFRRLYLLSQFDDPDDRCEGRRLTVCHLDAAFKKDASPEVASIVDAVINRWYHGTEPYDLSRIIDTPVDPELPQIAGRIEEAYLTKYQIGGQPLASISASDDIDRLLFVIRFSHRSRSAVSAPVRIVEAYEDGFEYQVQRKTLSDLDRGEESAWVAQSSDRVVGRHWVIVYDGERKIAQVEYEVVP